MKANNLKIKEWKKISSNVSDNVSYELRGSEINKCFGKVQMNKKSNYVFIRAMISTEDPFTTEIPYTNDFRIIHKEWEVLMNQLLNKMFI